MMKISKELCHPIHPHHKLNLEYTEIPFECNACKETGIGLNYKCHQNACEFNLHKACALAPSTLNHPFYKKCHFQLHNLPPGPTLRLCNACHNEIQGLVYHCKKCGFDIHPCCANLPRVLNYNGGFELYLYNKLSRSCNNCGRKGQGWGYASKCKMYNIHVSCVKKMVVENWEAKYLNLETNMLPSIIKRNYDHYNYYYGDKSDGGNLIKGCEIAGSAVNIIVSAIMGDPTALIAGVIGRLISK